MTLPSGKNKKGLIDKSLDNLIYGLKQSNHIIKDFGNFDKSVKQLEKYTSEQVSEMYDDLWRKWFDENPELLEELAKRSKGKILYDPFSYTSFQNQAKSITKILDEFDKINK